MYLASLPLLPEFFLPFVAHVNWISPCMELLALLQTKQSDIVLDATESLEKARLRHYQQSSSLENSQRLSALFGLVVESIRTRDLIPVVTFSQELARKRFHQGFDLAEVQTAYHVLEETLWRSISNHMPPDDLPTAFGLSSTVLGAAKDALALEYVSLASKQHLQSLDLSALFRGT